MLNLQAFERTAQQWSTRCNAVDIGTSARSAITTLMADHLLATKTRKSRLALLQTEHRVLSALIVGA